MRAYLHIYVPGLAESLGKASHEFLEEELL